MTNQQQTWLALEITIEAKATEAAEFALSEAGASGTEINLLGVGETPENIVVTGYFNEKPAEDFLQNQLSEALRIYDFDENSVKQIEWRAVENKDWLEEWKKHWRPTETGKFIVAPAWFDLPEKTDKTVIRIEPSMAFGTGTHETTRLCLRAIEENYQPEMSFFDVGTGTGILAIAVAKLATENTEKNKSQINTDLRKLKKNLSVNSVSSVAKILACDTDADSIKIARENAELNDARNVEFYVGSIDENTPEFDFVGVNLTADVIIPLLPLLAAKTGKMLLLSGILKEQETSVTRKLYELRITNCELRIDGEWISILVKI